MPDYIRVRMNDAGHEITIRADRFDKDAATKLDKPALGPNGLPLPPKYRTTVTKAAARKTSAPKTAQPEPGDDSASAQTS